MPNIELTQSDFEVPKPCQNWALFLDIDGTLIDIAAGPDAVIVPEALAPTLASASDWLGGALAIVSGRPFGKIDELMAPLKLPCAGEHGAVLRLPDGTFRNAKAECAVPEAWKSHVRAATQGWSGVVVEDKPYSIAAHFRRVPERERDVHDLLESVVAGNSQGFEVLSAHMAFEVRHHKLTKAAAVHEFMKHAPFCDRIPVFVGDDVTDEDGFRAAQELGGIALHVHGAFKGRTSNVRRWLEAFRSADIG